MDSGHAAGAFLRTPRMSGARRGSPERRPAFFGAGVSLLRNQKKLYASTVNENTEAPLQSPITREES